MKIACSLAIPVLLLLVFPPQCHGLGTEQFGPDPTDRPSAEQPGWPKGIVELARHRSRVYSSWVNGNEHFYFEAQPEDMNGLLELFGRVQTRDPEIRVVPGTGNVMSFHGREIGYNFVLHVVTGIARAHTEAELRRGNISELPLAPRLTIHFG